MEYTDKELKKIIGKKIKVEYLDWGDLRECEGILERVNKASIIVDGRKIRKGALDIKILK